MLTVQETLKLIQAEYAVAETGLHDDGQGWFCVPLPDESPESGLRVFGAVEPSGKTLLGLVEGNDGAPVALRVIQMKTLHIPDRDLLLKTVDDQYLVGQTLRRRRHGRTLTAIAG